MTEPPSEPRVSLISDAEADGAVAELFARVETETGRVPNLYRMLAQAPELLEAWIAVAWPLRHDSVAARPLRELLIMRTAQLDRVDYEWRQHWRMATESGVSEAQLLALANWRESTQFSAAERAALAMTDELSESASLADPTWDELRDHFSERECIELVLTAGFYACVSRVLSALRVPLEESAKSVPGVDEAGGGG